MLINMEEKYKYYLSHIGSKNAEIQQNFDFSIPIAQFEEILKEFTEKFPTISAVKNGHKLYGIHNKFFKIFQDGSCYGYFIATKTCCKFIFLHDECLHENNNQHKNYETFHNH